MDEEGKPKTGQSELPPTPRAKEPEPVDAAPATPANQLTQVKEQMSAFEKSTLRWAKTAVSMSGLAAIFVCLQWWEMHTGSADTHNLAVAAGNQATWTQRLATNIDTESGHMKDLADRMKDQADRTKTVADQAIIQANAARSAAHTARNTLHISERAYLTLGTPVDDFAHKQINVPIVNNGHIPSGAANLVVHEAMFGNVDPAKEIIPINDVLERHWARSIFPTVPTGAPYVVTVRMPALVQNDISNGKQAVLIVIVMTYNDGFPNFPEQKWLWCDVSDYVASTKAFSMKPCTETADAMLGIITKLDEYPEPKYRQPN